MDGMECFEKKALLPVAHVPFQAGVLTCCFGVRYNWFYIGWSWTWFVLHISLIHRWIHMPCRCLINNIWLACGGWRKHWWRARTIILTHHIISFTWATKYELNYISNNLFLNAIFQHFHFVVYFYTIFPKMYTVEETKLSPGDSN